MISCCNFLKLFVLVVFGVLSYYDVFVQVESIVFGCLVLMFGFFVVNGKFVDMGMKLVLQKYGKVFGKSISYVILDIEGKFVMVVCKMQEIIEKGMCFFVGGIFFGEVLVMGKEVDKVGVVFIIIVGVDEIIGSDCNCVIFCWLVLIFGVIEQIVCLLLEKLFNVKCWYIIML